MSLIMTNFQHNLIFDKETIKKNNNNKKPEEFDMDHEFLTSLFFSDGNYDPHIELSGKLWLRDLFMKAQTNILQLSRLLYSIFLILITGSYLISTIIFDIFYTEWNGELRETEKPPFYWWFNMSCFLGTFHMVTANSIFLWFSFWDANRRIWLMRQVTGSLELSFHTKDKTAIRMPTVNFMDTQSLLSWLETRKLVLDTGERFQVRI